MASLNYPKKNSTPTVSMISLGCPRTLVDSEVYLGRLKQSGYRIVPEVEGSDVVFINTCSFIQESIQESIDAILQVCSLKEEGKVRAVVVAGCLVQRFKQDLIRELPEVDGFVGVDGFSDIETVARRVLQNERLVSLRPYPNVLRGLKQAARVALTPSHYAYLKISEGCLKGCSFCVIPKIKGPLSSRPIEDLVAEAKQLVEERGVKELIVVGQDTSDYGVDLYGKPQIASLLQQLAKIEGLRWMRLLYCHPRGVSDELIETISTEPTLCKYLDTAIEHADDEVLNRMNRRISQEQLRHTIGRLRRRIPGLTLRTSVIVGFPGETEKAFKNLMGFLEEIRFERLGAFQYSPEEGSASARFLDSVPEAVRQKRFEELMQLQQTIAAELNTDAIGKTFEVVIDEADSQDANLYHGRTSGDCPEVDGQVFVQSDRKLKPGEYLPVTITDSYEYDLIGVASQSH